MHLAYARCALYYYLNQFNLIYINSIQFNYKQFKLQVMKQLFNKLFSIRYNEIVQCPETQNITTTLIVGGHTMGL